MRPCAEMHADLALDLEPLADDLRQVVEHFREVAARLALRQDGRDEEPRVEHGNTPREVAAARPAASDRSSARRRAMRNSVPTGADELIGHHAEAGRQRVTGAQRARDQVDRFGKLFLELVQPLAAGALHVEIGQQAAEQPRPAARPEAERERTRTGSPNAATHAIASRKVPTVHLDT